jgi:hypothetical protein
MSSKREMTLRESETDPELDAVSAGYKYLVMHNRQLIQAGIEKDNILISFVEQAQAERTQFWGIQASLVAKFTELIDTMQQLKDKQADREEKRKDNEASRELKQQIYGDIRQLGHIAVNQATKRPMIKEEEKGLLAAFIESLDKEQQDEFLSKLRPPQMAAFSKLVDGLKEQEDRSNGKDNSDASH